MAETKLNEKINSNLHEFYFVSKAECDIEETPMEEVEEDTCMDSNDYEHQNIHEEMSYYQEELSADDSIEEFDPDVHSVLRKKVKTEWQDLSEQDPERDGYFDEPEDDEEETIATFVTSTGQQLALYAVEDSEEVFAVAEYDESGQPPTNFQFLMKSDVEKLIGEGAVRTVKKPTQMKKQTYRGNEKEKDVSPKKVKVESTELAPVGDKIKCQDDHLHKIMVKEDVCSDDLDYQDIEETYIIEEQPIDEKNHVIQATQSPEIVQESTVQNIFHDDDDLMDEELTFDEIEKSLAWFAKSHVNKRSILKKSFDLPITNKTQDGANKCANGVSLANETFELKVTSTKKGVDKQTRQLFNNSGTLKTRHVPRALLGRKGKNADTTTVFIHGSTALICCPIKEVEPELKIAKESDAGLSKIKRPRKQQLTTVDRADSEIIIQPASLVEEQEEEPAPKKRGRRKKKRTDFGIKNYSKQMSKSKRRRIEVIDIDVDEEQERHIEEITIDDNKENEVIMVDSDDDTSQEEKSNNVILKCEHCSRSFRQKRALDTHTRVCPKSPSTRRRVDRELTSKSSGLNSGNKKQYVCKICAEKFDVVVALARHVRSHNKKKASGDNDDAEQVVKDKEIDKEHDDDDDKEGKGEEKLKSNETKNKNRITQLWKVKKMCCNDCGRWFASSALLSAHRLQHATKKSEKQMKRCKLCNKLFRSRIAYLHHMKMHSKSNTLQKTLRHTRQSSSKMTNLRKRGRSRKL